MDVEFMDITIKFAKDLFEGNLSFPNTLFTLNSESGDEPMTDADNETESEPELMADAGSEIESEDEVMTEAEAEPTCECDHDSDTESETESMIEADRAQDEVEARARLEEKYSVYSDDKSDNSGAVSDSTSQHTVSQEKVQEKVAYSNERIEKFIEDTDKNSRPLEETYTDPDTDSKSPDFNNPYWMDSDTDYTRGTSKYYRNEDGSVAEYRDSAVEIKSKQEDGTYKSMNLSAQEVEQHMEKIEQNETRKFDDKLSKLNYDKAKLRELGSEFDKAREDY